jgi:hypothetical protein
MTAGIIRAELKGSNCCEALGVTARGHAPVLDLCRALVAAGHDPHRPLHAYRGDVLALKIRSIAEGAKLTVRDDRAGPRFAPWEPLPRRVKSRTRKKAEGVDTASDLENGAWSRTRRNGGGSNPDETPPYVAWG